MHSWCPYGFGTTEQTFLVEFAVRVSRDAYIADVTPCSKGRDFVFPYRNIRSRILRYSEALFIYVCVCMRMLPQTCVHGGVIDSLSYFSARWNTW